MSNWSHKRGNPDIVHTDPPKDCACNKSRKHGA